MTKRLLNLLTSLDQLAFCLLTLGKYPTYHTVSGFAYKWERKGSSLGKALRVCIDILFRPLRSDHCLEAYLTEVLFEKRQPYK